MFMTRLDQSAAPKSSEPTRRFTDKQGQYLAFIYGHVRQGGVRASVSLS
jgi:hypothetical protein